MRRQLSRSLGALLACVCLLAACKGPGGEPGSSQPPTRPAESSSSSGGWEPAAESTGPADSGSSSASPESSAASRTDSSSQGTGGTGSTSTRRTARVTTAAATKPPAKTAAPTAAAPKPSPAPIKIKTPAASGTVVYQENGACIDASHTADGYIMVKCTSTVRLKLQVIFGSSKYNYDLNKDGTYEVFPLQGGDGDYTVRVMENVSGTKYRERYAVTLHVKLADVYAPYLYPNQYVNFTASSQAVKKAYEICAGLSNDLKKIEAVYTYITNTIAYDTGKAEEAKAGKLSGYLPNVDAILKSQKGICFDYAALLAAMLRAQNIPTKLIIGTVSPGELSHAWNMIYTKEKGWIAYKIEFRGGSWKLVDSTFGASMGQDIEAYIGNGSQYTQLRVY